MARSFRLERLSNVTLFLPKDLSRLQFGPKALPGMFLGYALHAGGIWRDIMVADIEELKKMESTHKKTQCKGSVDTNVW